MKDWLKWIGLGLLLVPLNAIFHELGHYLVFQLFGADDIVLHYASVSSERESLSQFQKGLAAFAGPFVSFVFLVLALGFTQKEFRPIWLIVGLVTMLRGLVNLPFLIAKARGFQPQPNFDEFNFSTQLGLNPVLTSILTLSIILFAVVYFSLRAFRSGGYQTLIKLWLAVIAGLIFWASVGPSVLP